MKENKKYYIFEINLTTLNIFSIILLITLMLLTYVICKFCNIDFSCIFNDKALGVILLTYIIYIILHEILHGISYVLYGAEASKITFGAHLEKGILCCLCKQNITKKNILNSLLFPLFYIGIITYIIGILINSPLLIILSVMNISGCAGDIVMFNFFIKLNDIEYTEFDNPTSFALYTNEDLRNMKPFGLKYIDCKDNIERNDLKKIKISKLSYLFFGVIILISITLLFS